MVIKAMIKETSWVAIRWGPLKESFGGYLISGMTLSRQNTGTYGILAG